MAVQSDVPLPATKEMVRAGDRSPGGVVKVTPTPPGAMTTLSESIETRAGFATITVVLLNEIDAEACCPMASVTVTMVSRSTMAG